VTTQNRPYFAVFHAGLADSVERARQLVQSWSLSESRLSTGAYELVDEQAEGSSVTDAQTLLSIVRAAESDGAIVAARWPAFEVLSRLLDVTKDRGLAVFDIEISRLYDPRARVDAQLFLPNEVKLPYVTRDVVHDLVSRPIWSDPDSLFFGVERAEEEYIQTLINEDGSYELEHRDGGPDRHFAATIDDGDLVAHAIWSWATQSTSWRTAVPWVVLTVDDGCLGRSPDGDVVTHAELARASLGVGESHPPLRDDRVMTLSDEFNAKYRGWCALQTCERRQEIEQGDVCQYVDGHLMHMVCARRVQRGQSENLCADCFQYHNSGECP
jgi:hypothetical protein